MDLNQRKLNKSEWDSIEVPVSANEQEVLQMITKGYHDINIKENNFNSIFTYLKIEYSELLEDYLFNKYLRSDIEEIIIKNKIEFIKFVKKETKKRKHHRANEGAIANEGANEGANATTTNTISFLGTWSNSDRSSAIQNISILFNGLKSIPNSSFLGNSPISTNQVDNLSSCVASCSALSNCTGATYNKDQKICTLSSGKGSVVPSRNSGNIAIVSENLYYLNQIKQLNEQLLELNHQIRTSIHQGRPVYNETIQELGKSSTDLKDTYHQLQKERLEVKKMMKEFENLDSEQQESSLMSSGHYSLFVFYLILCIIVVLFLIFMFWTPSSSSTNSNTNNSSSIFNNEGS